MNELVVDYLYACDVETFRGQVFRGQADHSWDLRPVMLRHSKSLELNHAAAVALEERALGEFKNAAHLYLETNEFIRMQGQGPLSWWCHMRHWQAPTRLLDWTRSFYVGTYFACIDLWNCDGAIWAAKADLVEGTVRAMNRALPEGEGPELLARRHTWLTDDAEPAVVVFVENRIQSERMLAQQGLFSLGSNLLREHGSVLRALQPADDDVVTQLRVPREAKPTILRQLRDMNITARALFPGPDGHGKAVDELIRLGS